MDFIGELGEDYTAWRRQLVLQELVGCHVRDPGIIYEQDVRESLSAYMSSGGTEEYRTATSYAVVALFYEMVNNYVPNPCSLTYSWFGFSTLSDTEHPALVGVYQALILNHECGIHEFERAFQSRKLSALIESKFSLLPKKGRGIFYKWFSEKKNFFDGLQPILCDVHYKVYPRSGFSQKSWPSMRIPKAYHPDEEIASLKDMAVKVSDCIPVENHDLNPLLPMSEIAVIALFYETLSDKLPTWCSLTYHSFGFSKVHPLDQQALADLYKALVCELKCPKRLFLQAYNAGRLFDLIKSSFSKGPAKLRTGCYNKWFIHRKALFDSLKPLSPLPVYPPSELAAKAWKTWNAENKDLTVAEVHARLMDYLTEQEKTSLTFTNMTDPKVAVVALFYEVLTDGRDEESPAFSFFGWDDDKKDEILRLYQTLIICLGCKVEEFLQAYEKRKVGELIESKYSQLPAHDRGLYYKRWFPVQRAVFEDIRPVLKSASPVIVIGARPGDKVEWTMNDIHERLLHFLATDEEVEFKRMTPNKAAVIELYLYIVIDCLPFLGSICYTTFGFDKVKGENEVCLLGLYQGLISHLDTQLQAFLDAYESGKLSELIESRYSEIPEGFRGGYYRWFLKYRSVIDGIKPPPFNVEGCRKSMEERRKFAASVDSCFRVPFNEGETPSSEEKNVCRVCDKISNSRCGKCKKVWYCSRNHQTQDWKEHKKSCSM